MSNYLGVATVTAALKRLILEGISYQVQDLNLNISSKNPKKLELTDKDIGIVNVYLYQAVVNTQLRNMDMPLRDENGELIHRSTLPLNLFYLISFYGDEDALVPQRLMGATSLVLNEESVLTPEKIKKTIQDPNVYFLKDADLGDQEHKINISLMNLDIEEMSKFWSVFFQMPHALSLHYKVSIIFLEGEPHHRDTKRVITPNVHANTTLLDTNLGQIS